MDVETTAAVEALETSGRFDAGFARLLVSEALARCAERGLGFRVRRDMDALSDLAAAEAAKGTWYALIPPLDAKASLLTPENSFWFELTDGAGALAGTQAVHLYDWADTDLAREAAALRLLYRDPASQRREGEAWSIGGSAPRIAGKALFSGAVWYRPDHRGARLIRVLSRLVRAMAHARWDVDHIFTFMARGNVERGVAKSAGYPNVEWTVETRNALHQEYDLALLWMDRDGFHADLAAFAASLGHARPVLAG